ncbi:hypothetical protein D9757_010819 [Collybiopsis confluens]|uniref:Uncharacterized protein n=1 Tax=Collybiopsis confluens TaxID=2823264 RepID=A0A8H5LVR0_9AGAR|nr:hypothetical protein D9757_010819 [Collybiopsis confluens]
MTSSAPFRYRPVGRASSPPTWACYEQIPYDEDDDEFSDDDYSDSGPGSGSCSEDDEGYRDRKSSDEEVHDSDNVARRSSDDSNGLDTMDIDEEGKSDEAEQKNKEAKGKQKATEAEAEPVPEPPQEHKHRHGRRHRQRNHTFTLRPILTIQRSQGFVWNQDLFVPPYIKDRYVASTSPPNRGFLSTSASSTNSALIDYEIEVVEIRVKEGEGIP